MVGTAATTKARVLLVDDEPRVLESTLGVLMDDFEVTTASSCEQALALCVSADFDVLCTDLSLPGMDGIELIRRVSVKCPMVSSVLLTGHFDHYIANQQRHDQSFLFVVKPCDPSKLLDVVNQAAAFTRNRRAMRGMMKRPAGV